MDGPIIGGPAWKPDTTWLCLSGEPADRVATCLEAGPPEVEVIGAEIGGASALLSAVDAAAEGMGVREELERQWSRHGSGYAREVIQSVVNVAAGEDRRTAPHRRVSHKFRRRFGMVGVAPTGATSRSGQR